MQNDLYCPDEKIYYDLPVCLRRLHLVIIRCCISELRNTRDLSRGSYEMTVSSRLAGRRIINFVNVRKNHRVRNWSKWVSLSLGAGPTIQARGDLVHHKDDSNRTSLPPLESLPRRRCRSRRGCSRGER